MKISELPTEIKEKALEYQRKSLSADCNKNTDNLVNAFAWQFTDEGYDYWSDLHYQEEKESHQIKIFIVIFAIIAILIYIL